METASGGGAGSGDIAGIHWDLRLNQHDIQHTGPSLRSRLSLYSKIERISTVNWSKNLKNFKIHFKIMGKGFIFGVLVISMPLPGRFSSIVPNLCVLCILSPADYPPLPCPCSVYIVHISQIIFGPAPPALVSSHSCDIMCSMSRPFSSCKSRIFIQEVLSCHTALKFYP